MTTTQVQMLTDADMALQLQSEDPALRVKAIKAIARLGAAAAADHSSCIAACLADENVKVRIQAARALGQIGIAAAPTAAKELRKCLEASVEVEVKAAAIGALSRMSEIESSWLVRLLSEDKDAKVRVAAAGALGRLGPNATADAAEVLAAHLHDEELSVRVTAAGALAQHLSAATAALVQRLGDANPMVRKLAAKALGQMGDEVSPAVKEALSNSREVEAVHHEAAAPSLPFTPCARTSTQEVVVGDSKKKSRALTFNEAALQETKDISPVLPISKRRPDQKIEATDSNPCSAGRMASRGTLPRLLGTPTPRRGEKPGFFMPTSVDETSGKSGLQSQRKEEGVGMDATASVV
eukprot:TRINITY_DN37160_c0_g1_i1.p1 TRINITY_DN37160_c0_g1~~TRINITY_DN37160_c0_g1_i1.p1  ORF type:complete len:353 (-),score=109.88 TRINITY_DN37160_c0_g1_i1:55-1113(-)